MQAMILAAGFGTRLLPYTKNLPKPLFPLLNEPLLLLTIKRLQNAGFDHIIVNCHHLKEQIVEAISGLQGVVIQEEESILGTGGGLRMALRHMRDEPLLITNSDIYHSVDYLDLYKAHQAGNGVVTMALHDYPRFNQVRVQEGQVVGFGAAEKAESCVAFTGLHVLDPSVLQTIPAGQQYCIIKCYRHLIKDGEFIQVFDVSGCFWTDMGTVDDYLTLHGQLLQGEIDRWPEFSNVPDGAVLCHKKTDCPGVRSFQDWACVGRVKIPANVTLRRCVVWDDAMLVAGMEYSDLLLSASV